MNFDRNNTCIDGFKKKKPTAQSMNNILKIVSEQDTDYIEKLKNLKYKKLNRGGIIQIVVTTAAVLLLTAAFSLWAILGRGVRGAGNITDTPLSSTEDTVKTYNVKLSHEGEIIEGKESFQGFFDDYVMGKPCVLEVLYMDRPGSYMGLEDGEVPPLYTQTLVCNTDGTVNCKYDQPEGAYGILEFAFNEHKFDHMKLVLEREQEKYFLQLIDFDGGINDSEILLPLELIENKHENSDRLYDSAKAEPVSIVSGTVTAGEATLKNFFDSMLKGYYVSAEINGEKFCFKNEKDGFYMYDGSDFQHLGCRPSVTQILASDNNVWIGFISSTDQHTKIAEISTEEIERLGLLFSTAQIEMLDRSHAANSRIKIKEDGRLTSILMENAPVLVKSILPERPDYYIELNDYVTIYVYRDGNGGISDVFGFYYSYKHFASAAIVSDEFVQEVEKIITEHYANDMR